MFAQDDFSDAEYAAIGRVVRAFGFLEHKIASSVISLLNPTYEEVTATVQKRMAAVVSDSMGGRITSFLSVVRELLPLLDPQWLEEFEAKMKTTLELRNAFCHGVWSRGDDEKLKVTFFDKKSVKLLSDPTIHLVSVTDLMHISSATLENAEKIKKHFVTSDP